MLHISRVAHFPCCPFSCCIFFRVVLFSSCTLSYLTFFVLHSFDMSPFLVMHVSPFLGFYFFRVVSCWTMLHLDVGVFKLHYFHVFFSYHSVFIMYIFGGAIFSCRTIFRVAMFSCCTFGTLFSCCAFFRVVLFSCCNFFRVGFFSCFTFFLLHIFFCSSLFMLQFFMLYFFRFGPSILTGFLFYSFHGALFRCCFSSHCALFTLHPSMMHSFHVAPFFSSTFLMLYFFHKALSHGNLPCSAYIMLLPLRLHFFIFWFF